MRNILWILLLLFIVSCRQGNDAKVSPDGAGVEEKARVQEIALAPPSTYEPETNSARAIETNTISKKVIKEGEISLETGNLTDARKAILDKLTQLGGYVDEENQNNDNDAGRKQFVLKIRITAQQFDKFLMALSSVADRVESKSIRIKDVTTEYIDITTRLNNKKLLENRYKDLLQKANRMADVLEVESKLAEIRSDVETTQGQLNYLNKQIAFSSLEITLFTQSAQNINEGNGFGYKLKTALADGWGRLQGLFFGLISVWPYVLLLVLIYLLFKWWRRNR